MNFAVNLPPLHGKNNKNNNNNKKSGQITTDKFKSPKQKKRLCKNINVLSPQPPKDSNTKISISSHHKLTQKQQHSAMMSSVSSINQKLFSPKSLKSVSTASAKKFHSSQLSTKKNKKSSSNITEIIVASRFHLLKKIGKGSFGVAYESMDLEQKEKVAIKLERKREDRKNSQVNVREISILKKLLECHRVPSLIWHGQYKQYRVMAIELQGMNLSDLYELCNRKFSLKTIIFILIECIYCMQDIHSKGIVHRDIKPQNFIIHRNPNKNKIHCIDFGLSSWFLTDSKEHIEYNSECSPVGTARYASINNHRGVHQTRRDDLESIGYMIIFFLKQKLPWQGLKEHGRLKKWRKIQKKKEQTPNFDLTQNLPNEFTFYLDYVKKLKYEEEPDYYKLIKIFKKLYKRKGFYKEDMLRIDEDYDENEDDAANDYNKWNVSNLIIPDWIKCETPTNEEDDEQNQNNEA